MEALKERVDALLDLFAGPFDSHEEELQAIAGMTGLIKEIEADLLPLQDRAKEIRKDVFEYVKTEGKMQAGGFEFLVKSRETVTVASWMRDRVKSGEPVPGLELATTSALYVQTPRKPKKE